MGRIRKLNKQGKKPKNIKENIQDLLDSFYTELKKIDDHIPDQIKDEKLNRNSGSIVDEPNYDK